MHLGQSDLDGADVTRSGRRACGSGFARIRSKEFERALSFDPDYVALGPIFPTILKAMSFAPQGLGASANGDGASASTPLVAIGGLNCRARKACLAAGADIVSVVTDITLNADPEGRAREWIAATRAAVNRVALTIAGSDSGGGAGIQADLKTFAALGVYGVAAITALTAQNTRGVLAVHLAPPDIVVAQIEAAFIDFDVAAIKIGMLGRSGIVKAVASYLSAAKRGVGHSTRLSRPTFLVFDPVMVASSGDALAGAGSSKRSAPSSCPLSIVSRPISRRLRPCSAFPPREMRDKWLARAGLCCSLGRGRC